MFPFFLVGLFLGSLFGAFIMLTIDNRRHFKEHSKPCHICKVLTVIRCDECQMPSCARCCEDSWLQGEDETCSQCWDSEHDA